MAAFPRGRFCWHELMTTDTAAAAAFYRKIAGWNTQAWPADPSYTLWLNGDQPIGGMMLLPEEVRRRGAPPHWMPFMAVSDARDLVRQVADFGGKILKGPSVVATVGTYAVLQDPQGAAFGVLQPEADAPGHDRAPSLGEFSWHELVTTDPEAAWNFYEMLFGWEKMDAMDMGPGGTYQMFGRRRSMLGGMYRKPPEMPGPPHWLSYAMVPSADDAAQLVKRQGGEVLAGPMEVPGGDRITTFLDPQGAAFAVHAAARQAPKPKATKAVKTKARKKKAATKSARKKTAKKAKRSKGGTKKKTTRKKATKKTARKKTAAKRKAAKGKAAKGKAAKKGTRSKKVARKGIKRKATRKKTAAKRKRSRKKK